MPKKPLDISIVKGRDDLAACVFVHGLGMSKLMWTDPAQERIMADMVSLKFLLRGYKEHKTLWHDLMALGHTVITWSQRRPVGPAETAVDEMRDVIEHAHNQSANGNVVILIGMSKGGLISRRFMDKYGLDTALGRIKGFATLGTPHMGSNLAAWADYLAPLSNRLSSILPKQDRNKITGTIKKVLGFIESEGVRELMPDSDLIKSLGAIKSDIHLFSIGGTDPGLFSVPDLFKFPDSLIAMTGLKRIPDEIQKGMGDGLVSKQSSIMPGGVSHIDFPVSHAALLVDPEARGAVVKGLREAGLIAR